MVQPRRLERLCRRPQLTILCDHTGTIIVTAHTIEGTMHTTPGQITPHHAYNQRATQSECNYPVVEVTPNGISSTVECTCTSHPRRKTKVALQDTQPWLEHDWYRYQKPPNTRGARSKHRTGTRKRCTRHSLRQSAITATTRGR